MEKTDQPVTTQTEFTGSADSQAKQAHLIKGSNQPGRDHRDVTRRHG